MKKGGDNLEDIKLDTIRLEMLRNRITGKEACKEAGITEFTFSKWLNNPDLPNYKRQLLLEAVQAAAARKAVGSD